MKPNDQKNLVNSINKLVISNGLLAEAHHKALSIMERSMKEKDDLITICREIYEGLDIKTKRSLSDESFYLGLKKILQG